MDFIGVVHMLVMSALMKSQLRDARGDESGLKNRASGGNESVKPLEIGLSYL